MLAIEHMDWNQMHNVNIAFPFNYIAFWLKVKLTQICQSPFFYDHQKSGTLLVSIGIWQMSKKLKLIRLLWKSSLHT